jgi:mRNA-degrading endonuclease YafQ of YafQ-DinJ toxin-antitoxin module
MPFTLVSPESFERHARKFLRKHPELTGDFGDVLQQLENDPLAPRLKLHPLSGRHAGKHAVSLSYSYRIVLVLAIRRKEIVLLDVGTHDEVYGK